MDLLTAYVCRHLFESTEIAGNKTFTDKFQMVIEKDNVI
jgi:hypothetical protein